MKKTKGDEMRSETRGQLDVSEPDVMIHLRIPPEIFAVIKPAAKNEGLKLPSWIRRTLVMAAKESKEKQNR
jgi:predicted HicB family RNase H-like nuclease